jgi:hypothetical protein
MLCCKDADQVLRKVETHNRKVHAELPIQPTRNVTRHYVNQASHERHHSRKNLEVPPPLGSQKLFHVQTESHTVLEVLNLRLPLLPS